VEKQLILLQQLFLDNAAIHDIAIIMTDTQGKFITRPVGDQKKLQPMIETGQMDKFSTHLVSLLLTDDPILQSKEYELTPKVKATFIPVHSNNRIVYYIGFAYSFEMDIETHLKYFKTISSVVEALLTLENEKGWIRRQVSAVRELSVIVEQPPSSPKLHQMMELLFHAHKGIDFLGYAEKEHGVGFRVTELVHHKESTLLDATFSLGEGFLGQVATTRQLGYWEHIVKDPRIGFFIQNQLHPQTLFCYPIMNGETLIGLLFGGSETETDIAEGLLHLGQAVAALIGVQQTFQSLRSDRDTYYLRMSMLMEICKTLSIVKDIKRVLFILVDLSLNLVQGSFSCVILKQAADKMNIVSRGMPHSQSEKYLKDISVRYAETATNRLDERAFDGAGLYTFDGIQTMEFPLMYGDTFYGVLSIAISTSNDFIEYKEFIQSITIVASSAIDRIQVESTASAWEAIELLHRSMQQWNPPAYMLSQLAREMIVEYTLTTELPASQSKMLEMVCLLYAYDPHLLGNILKATPENAALIHLANEVRQIRVLMEEASNKNKLPLTLMYSDNSQLVALALFYTEHLSSFPDEPPVYIRADLRESFAGFVAKRQIVDMEMSIFEPVIEPRNDHADLKQAIKALTLLSAREQEVIALVAEGRSNREIAEKLIISEHTVKNHMTSIFNKMGVTDRSHLIAMVYQLGFSAN
jgi:DNA-binding CsgD family transcriptional regulator